ncbi:Acyl-ACP thioesterase [Mariniphaga anaerophila]|uniref:Acyl-ACP thioesterase n=1 Tax=Mariniphaga anaerophila TaxID=1484053 RepID=A0A1M5AR08_9BACT|nr:acyl-ACP thioesterase domain-containing protein [Mariniphaga anaerophila]SHF32679.1 Acyl-ACP thioesterase [Mariniphaga anaerophila]
MKHINHLSTRSYFINRFGKLSTSFMFYQMQDIAWEHAAKLGFGYDNLKQDEQFWVLSKLLVKIDRRPVWGEDFALETWSRGTDGFFGYRDFNFVDKQGANIIQATSSWLVLDAKSKRIVRLNDFTNFPKYEESVFGNNAGKVSTPKSNDKLEFTPVRFNEIDINQHFNSGRYIERIIDSFSFDFHQANELIEFEVNFLKEGMPADRLAVKKQVLDENHYMCSVVRESDGADLIRVRLVWKKRK